MKFVTATILLLAFVVAFNDAKPYRFLKRNSYCSNPGSKFIIYVQIYTECAAYLNCMKTRHLISSILKFR